MNTTEGTPAPDDSGDEIMEATYRALCRHGYANLTMQHIADECGKSTSLLHYHYDTKQDLLRAFLDYIVDQFAEKVRVSDAVDPAERLLEFIDWFVFDEDDAERRDFHRAMLELKAQAPHNEAFREQLLRSDRAVRGAIAEIIEDGIEQGVFREVDPDRTAALVFAALDGARMRQITLGLDDYTRTVTDALAEHVIAALLAEDGQ